MTMTDSPRQVLTYDGEGTCLNLEVENEGWSTLKPASGFASARYTQSQSPFSLRLTRTHTGFLVDDLGTFKDVRVNLSNPTFDLGLGCFGNPSRVVETGRGELVNETLWWTDYSQIRTAQELFNGKVWGDDEWINFQMEGAFKEVDDSSTDGEYSTDASGMSDEEDKGPPPSFDIPTETDYRESGNRSPGSRDLLAALDVLEAARPKSREKQITIPGNREGIWDQPNFQCVTSKPGDWVDEAEALESSASMPEGTKYYQVHDADNNDWNAPFDSP